MKSPARLDRKIDLQTAVGFWVGGGGGVSIVALWRIKTQNASRSLLDAQAKRIRTKREQFNTFQGLVPESEGQNLALTVFYVADLLDSGTA